MAHKFNSLLGSSMLTVLVLPAACGGQTDTFAFHEDAYSVESVTGGKTGSDRGTGGTGPDTAFDPYRRGGYGGRIGLPFGILGEDGRRQDLSYLEVCGETDNWFLSSWEAETCRAGSLCTSRCEADADCASLDGPLESQCEFHAGFDYGLCTLPCEADADCLYDMICADDFATGLRSCLITDIPWAPGCEGFCLEEEPVDGAEAFLCNRDAECCGGSSCSPSGQCQVRECLPVSWECEGDGVPCCAGSSCQSGYCQAE